MKVALIQPPLLERTPLKITSGVEVEVPLGLASLASYLETKGYQCEITDSIVDGYGLVNRHENFHIFGLPYEQLAEKVVASGCQFVGISCIFFNQVQSTLFVAQHVKLQNPALPVIAGGIGSFLNAEELLRSGFVDVVIIGEGEESLAHTLKTLAQDPSGRGLDQVDGIVYLRDGVVRRNPKTKFIQDLDRLPSPAYHLFDLEKYFKIGIPFANKKKNRYVNVLSSRGCPFDCIFCAAHNIWSRRIRPRSPRALLAEVRELKARYRVEEIHFSDENLTYDRKRAMAILEGLKELGLSWTAPNGLMVASLDPELIQLMAQSGCHSVSLAIESGSQRVLREIIRKPLKLSSLFPVVRELKKNGIHCRGFFLIGLPGETKKEICDTILLSHFLRLDQNEIMVALPYPGTRLYETCCTGNFFSQDFDVKNLTNNAGPITTPQFSPAFLYRVKEADRFLFFLRTGKKKLPELLASLFRRNRLKSFLVFAVIFFFALKLIYIKRGPGEAYFSGEKP